jgi:sec-independent protein translocase protein TatB
MEILGIGPGEFVLILIVLLVVVGPERLPGLARQAGGFLVRARNWLQTSPDAALVMRARAEIEAELASIKNSLMEVQVVRDEVLGAARQFEDSVGALAPPKLDLNSLVNPPAEQTIAANEQAVLAGEAPTLLPDSTTAADTPLDQRSTLELPDDSMPTHLPTEDRPTNGLNGLAYDSVGSEPTVAASAAPTLDELESINIRLQAIMTDMWALQQQLKQRGALDETWQPPSLDVQLPTPATAAPADPPSPAEPIEDEVVLAARKRLEQLTPMKVSYQAPPAIEDAPADSATSAMVAAEASTAATSAEQATLIEPPAALATKARKRRAAATADQSAIETAETPADGVPPAKTPKRRTPATVEPIQEAAEAPKNGAPAAKARKRRTPAASAERADETEPVTTEKAS